MAVINDNGSGSYIAGFNQPGQSNLPDYAPLGFGINQNQIGDTTPQPAAFTESGAPSSQIADMNNTPGGVKTSGGDGTDGSAATAAPVAGSPQGGLVGGVFAPAAAGTAGNFPGAPRIGSIDRLKNALSQSLANGNFQKNMSTFANTIAAIQRGMPHPGQAQAQTHIASAPSLPAKNANLSQSVAQYTSPQFAQSAQFKI